MSETVMKNAFALLNDEQINFICGEFKIDKVVLENMSDDEFNSLYESLCDIEVDEICVAGDGDLSEKGETVSDIVTAIGNEIASKQGYFDEEEFEMELKDEAS